MGWTDIYGKATALMVGTVVCISASIAGDTSQDLKTGFVLGATPRLQQIGELIGVDHLGRRGLLGGGRPCTSSVAVRGRPGRQPRAPRAPGDADEAS